MRVLIVGLGSIAQKHIKALRNTCDNLEIMGLRSNLSAKPVEGITSIFDINELTESLDFVIISNPTNLHLRTAEELLHLEVPLFIEKPLDSSVSSLDERVSKIDAKCKTYVACNLRFHSALHYIREGILKNKWGIVEEVNSYCGSYLPDWRSNTTAEDYRKGYSADEKRGGGVHLDVIHELDYVYWIFGEPSDIRKVSSSNSQLGISAKDYAHYVASYGLFTAIVTLNYFRKTTKRSLEIVTDKGLVYLDFIKGQVTFNNELIFESSENEVIETYTKQMSYFLDNVIGKGESMNTINDAAAVLKLAMCREIF